MDLQSLTPEQLAQLPVVPPPPGVQSNFDNPDSNAASGIIAISVILALMLLVVAMRMYSRIVIVKNPGPDDWAALTAAIIIAAQTSVPYYMLAHNWFGPHSWDLRLVVLLSPAYTNYIVALTFLSLVINLLAKLTLLLFIARIFPRRASPKTTYAVWFGIAFAVVAYVSIFIEFAVDCAPRASSNGSFPPACTGRVRQYQGVAAATVNAALDVYVLSIAIPSVFALQMPTKRKVGVSAVLGLGAIACGISLYTLYYRIKPSTDPIREQTLSLILTTIEPAIAVVTASLPALPAFWVEISTKVSTSVRGILSSGSAVSIGKMHGKGDSYTKSGYELHSRSTDGLHNASEGVV
ncbi:hypothetical protein GQX73_g499 [Xylaria multiplex]|uniref:Rhodopsin domain-containing protein n=1 Tax=Xylaria multiplex TaxID=323545 RepID=A0A7C8IXB4_9PEZI|nr:hypothetical protein GQX73_g499 [Xylaria multiplex]